MRFSGPKASPRWELAFTEMGRTSVTMTGCVEDVDEDVVSGSAESSPPKIFTIRATRATTRTTAASTPSARPPADARDVGDDAIGIGSELRREPHLSQ
jgi:hypothetical protein